MAVAHPEFQDNLAQARVQLDALTAIILEGRSSMFEHVARSRECITRSLELIAHADDILARR